MCHAAVRVNSISIHSLRIEGDAVQNAVVGFPHSFQSTPSVWRETARISGSIRLSLHFNPLTPYGGRHAALFSVHDFIDISIHSLRMEGDGHRGRFCDYS